MSLGLVLGLDLEGKSLEPTGIVVAVSDINKSLISQMESVIQRAKKKKKKKATKQLKPHSTEAPIAIPSSTAAVTVSSSVLFGKYPLPFTGTTI